MTAPNPPKPAVNDDDPSKPAALTAEQMTAVREGLGLKEGQDLPGMITGATKRTVSEALGLQKGQSFADMLKATMQEMIPKPPEPVTPPPKKGEEADPAVLELRADVKNLHKIAKDLQTEKEEAKAEAAMQKRSGLIRDAISKFPVRGDAQGLLVKSFVKGIEGPAVSVNDNGDEAIVEDKDGVQHSFESYLAQYFKENRWLLEEKKFSGSGARNKGSVNGEDARVDYSKIAAPEEQDKFHEAAKNDPEGREKREAEMRDHLAPRFAAMGLEVP